MISISKDKFWDTDLSVVESTFLPKGKKITDLVSTLDDRVPTQGCVLLNKTVNIDKTVNKITLFQKIYYAYFKRNV